MLLHNTQPKRTFKVAVDVESQPSRSSAITRLTYPLCSARGPSKSSATRRISSARSARFVLGVVVSQIEVGIGAVEENDVEVWVLFDQADKLRKLATVEA